MKKRIFRTLCALSFLGVAVAAVITILVSVRFNMEQMEVNVQETAQMIAESGKKLDRLDDMICMLDALPDNIRATLIQEDGTVLYESVAAAAEMENHLDRPEIQDAMTTGSGEASRNSATLNTRTYYYSIRLEDGHILRLAREYTNMYGAIASSMLLIVLWIAILAVVAVLVAKRLTMWLIRPVVYLADHMSRWEDIEIYDELEPFIRHIREQDNEIDEQKTMLDREREALNVLTRNMKEGVLAISGDRNIASLNPSVLSMLAGEHAKEEEFIGHTFLMLNRSSVWFDCINQALGGENNEAELNYQGAVYRLFASPIIHVGKPDGAIVIVLDVTQERLAEKVRQEFSANVSHELKTPLTSISGYAEMMELDMVHGKDDQIEFARRIHKEALRLIALINDIIRLSRIEEGAPKAFRMLELQELCQSTAESLAAVSDSTEVALSVTGEECLIMGEESMLTELVYNLCENAIKYNHRGGHVWIRTMCSKDDAVIEVQDDGIGIPEDSLQRVFERFYRVDKSRSKQTGGTGLGLSIVKHIVEYHNGRVELKSQLGVGTTIRVYLPLPSVKPKR